MLAALLAALLHRLMKAFSAWVLALVPAAIFAYLVTFIDPVSSGETIRASLPWVPSYGLDLTFLVDGLSLTFALAISGIGTLIVIYSGAYLKGHPHQGRFLAFILAFMGAMMGLVLADNMLALYGFWELTSVTSFLLIGFDHSRQAARRAAIQAVAVTGAGGLALLAGAILVWQTTGSWEIGDLLAGEVSLSGSPIYLAILVLFLAAAFTKSAQLPFHFWLPNAMEAPTPVSAFLHSATMVQGGVYLLSRMQPVLGGTPTWTVTLIVFGGATLLWGSIAALKQTDLKQMLAQTTLASLGLLIMLIGVGTETAVLAAMAYFIAHALYKASFFLIAGILDHETGTREITALGGLREEMPATFIAAILAAAAMIGLPPTVGYLAKEEVYLALVQPDWQMIVILAFAFIGNVVFSALALALVIRPFMGELIPTPKTPHDGPLGLVTGPMVLGAAGLVLGIFTTWFGEMLVAPPASAILAESVKSHFTLALSPWSIPLWVSILTWGVAGLLYLQLDRVRTVLRRSDGAYGWSFDTGFDHAMFGLIRASAAWTRLWHHGRLELYLVVLFVTVALALVAPLALLGGLPGWPAWPDLTFYEWGILGLALVGLMTVLMAQSRLIAIVSLGIQGLAVSMIFLLFGAPDLAFTQLMVEILTVVILALVMTRLNVETRDRRYLEDLLRDGSLALACGMGVTMLLLSVLRTPLDMTLTDFFARTSVAIAHGHNIVNVILVDYRGLDTLGEIAVVMTAGIAVLALIRTQLRQPASAPIASPKVSKRTRRRKAVAATGDRA